MNIKTVVELVPAKNNGRNSEGSFLRAKNGNIYFAYSRFCTDSHADDSPCDIAYIVSSDEGETWSEPKILTYASAFGVTNIMSVSGILLKDGTPCFFYLLREKDGTLSLGRSVLCDNEWKMSKCKFNCQSGFYVINNDRIIRLSDGRLAAPAAYHKSSVDEDGKIHLDPYTTALCFVSDDDGETFTDTPARIHLPYKEASTTGMQEPGIIERTDGSIYLWARTILGRQYECVSNDKMQTFTAPEPSQFTSPLSPMELYSPEENLVYAVYNPVPFYNGRKLKDYDNGYHNFYRGRTPLVLRKSTDDGITFGECIAVENDPDREYCYPSMFRTADGCLLLSYCKGIPADCGLNTIVIRKIREASI